MLSGSQERAKAGKRSKQKKARWTSILTELPQKKL